jgi:hypothetical protein
LPARCRVDANCVHGCRTSRGSIFTVLQSGQEISLQRPVNVASEIGESTWVGERRLEPLPEKTIAAASDELCVNIDHAFQVIGGQRA